MRRPLVAGNWKMNLDLASARELVAAAARKIGADETVETAICPTFVYLFPMAKAVAGTPIRLGAQDAYFEPSGAFTGEVSVAMIRETGCTYCILGHSERRHTIGPARPEGGVFGEDDAFVNRKVRAVISGGLTPILCIGETLAQREAGRTESVLERQIEGGLDEINADAVRRVVIAYEPVWAIGTGQNATAEQAQAAHAFIRGELAKRCGGEAAQSVRILYGGSVKAGNAFELMSGSDVDGALVGGASLKADEFCGIIEATRRAKRAARV